MNAAPSGSHGGDLPYLGRLVPDHRSDLGLKLDVFTDIGVVRHPIEIFFVFALLAKWARVREINAEDMSVPATLGVDTGTRVAILEPRSPYASVLFKYDIRNTGML